MYERCQFHQMHLLGRAQFYVTIAVMHYFSKFEKGITLNLSWFVMHDHDSHSKTCRTIELVAFFVTQRQLILQKMLLGGCRWQEKHLITVEIIQQCTTVTCHYFIYCKHTKQTWSQIMICVQRHPFWASKYSTFICFHLFRHW